MEHYGGKKSWLKHCGFLIIDRLGVFQSYRNVDWTRVKRLVFVCKGNICRSPYAEAKARALTVEAASFGLEAGVGALAPAPAIKTATAHGVYLKAHRSKPLRLVRINASDLLVTMEPSQAKALVRVAQENSAQVTLLGLWGSGRRPFIEDPLGRSEVYFDRCFCYIDVAVEGLIDHMKPR